MDFKGLESFHILAETRHFSKAAQARGLSQPALSRQIQALEDSLGHPLFIRSRSGVALTNFGKRFHQQVLPLFGELKNRFEEMTQTSQELSGEFSIGTYTELGISQITPVVQKIQAHHPKLRINLFFSKSKTLLEGLKKGELEMIIFTPPTDHANLIRYELTQENHVLVTGTAEAAQNFPLKANQFISYSKEDRFIPRMIDEYKKHDHRVAWSVSMTVNSLTAIIKALRGTDRFSVIPSHRIQDELHSEKLFQVEGPSLVSKLYISQLEEFRGEYRSKVIRKFFLDYFKGKNQL